MIELTKLNKKTFILNCELIESIESTPDTVVTLRNGKLYLVMETPQQIVDATVRFKQMLLQNTVPAIKQREEAAEL